LRTIIVRRLKGNTDSVHYLERDDVNGLKLLHRQQQADGVKAAYVFINERGQPFGRMGIGRMVERAGEAAGLPFPVHVHMLRHSTVLAKRISCTTAPYNLLLGSAGADQVANNQSG
jgi:site-specific recombinase XerD